MTKLSFITAIFVFCFFSFGFSQDPLNNYQWSSVDENSYNTIVQGNDPFNNTSDLLETTADGGWRGFRINHIPIDKTKSYRFSFWIKLSDVFPAAFGGNLKMEDINENVVSGMLNNSDVPSTDYYMLHTWGIPVLPNPNEWYLIVGFVKANTDTNTYTARTYDTLGNVVGDNAYPNIKWNTNAEYLDFSAFYKYDTATTNTSYTYDPRIKVVTNGDDSVDDLLQSTTNPDTGGGNNLWTSNSSEIYSLDNVAIGRTTVPSGYKLAVDGHIRAREIKVDTDTWPDYVFKKDYVLPTLEDIQKHIKEKGHLPNIPSAQEIEVNGLELGEMNKLLLEKIEELTLYLIQHREEIESLKAYSKIENK